MKKRIMIPLAVVFILCLLLAGYFESYYHETEQARAALVSTDTVTVSQTDYGWLFDGSGEDLLIFYPGAKVAETAYAPMLHTLAEAGCDAALVKMPLHMAFFGMNKADAIDAQGRRYIGGHSLGGAMAAFYAASHDLDGVILFGAYATKTLDEPVLLLAGSEDGVLNWENYEAGKAFAETTEVLIPGGNHAGFGNYGNQSGDNAPTITADAQQRAAVDAILEFLR